MLSPETPMPDLITKAAILVIALSACHGCLVVPVPIPVPISNSSEVSPSTTPSQKSAPSQQVQANDEKYKKTCHADALTESEGREITENSGNLETAADKLAITGKHKEAIRKYNEAAAAMLNEAITDGSAEDMEISAIWHNWRGEGIEGFREENRPLLQKSAESNFKIGTSYAKLGKLELAIDCFNQTIKIGILPPNDAIAYLNRGDAYQRAGNKEKAKADFQQAVNLFKKYKLLSYQKNSEKRLRSVSVN
ncbi:MAG: tetratricopeptide repeat protein [Oscillatoriales cyanobacterium]|nr:MAG: tetratricopeptide repeat protein [Oscillatoriales cyanobacterium]